MENVVEYFGIRHHGPGSARCLVAALEALKPSVVLIEGPADATELLGLLADSSMVPPVALLAYDTSNPSNAIFWPYTEFSPEYQAVRYALDKGIDFRLIDLPAFHSLTRFDPSRNESDASENKSSGPEASPADEKCETSESTTNLRSDPIGALALAAGYVDGESWWSDLIEENPSPGPVFSAVAEAMGALRELESKSEIPEHEARREAYMRLAVAGARKEFEGPIAVVCGAWHVPALQARHALKDDRDQLKAMPKVKAAITWAPWTEPRLAFGSGYGAGVRHPGWYKHVWRHGTGRESSIRWLLNLSMALRESGHPVSTASVIEAERLSNALASVRNRPAPNFEELQDAAVSCLCFGEELLYRTCAERLLSGSEVGEISTGTGLMPLMEDLKTQQRKAKLKPEALDRELSLDLRSDAGNFRSSLLHRLQALDVPWGRLMDAGRSRGTFREKWTLRWDPEFSVRLVEQLVYGATIERAASRRILMKLDEAVSLNEQARLLKNALDAGLPEAVALGIRKLGATAALSSDCVDLLRALEPMAEILRYGEARSGTTDHLGGLIRQIAMQSFIALPYASRDLDMDAATELAASMEAAGRALFLAGFNEEELSGWFEALHRLLDQPQSTPFVAGVAARHLYESDRISPEESAGLLGRRLSPGVPVSDAAGYFEGFLGGMSERLIHDEALRIAVDEWIMQLPEEDLLHNLPIFRRVFSGLDRNTARRLLEAVVRPTQSGGHLFQLYPDQSAWADHQKHLLEIMESGAQR